MTIVVAIFSMLITLLLHRYLDKYITYNRFDKVCDKAYKYATKLCPTFGSIHELAYHAYILDKLKKYYSVDDIIFKIRIEGAEIQYKNFEVERTLDNL